MNTNGYRNVAIDHASPSYQNDPSRDSNRSVTLTRGNHVLPHQSQITGRDLNAEKIERHRGGNCLAVRVHDDERIGVGYCFIVFSPESCAYNWTAFISEWDFLAFLSAYGLTADVPAQPAKGDVARFRVSIPDALQYEPLQVEAN